MRCVINFLFDRPVAAMVSSLQMLTEDVPMTMRLDAMMSRATHILSRTFAERRASARHTYDSGTGTEQTKDRTV